MPRFVLMCALSQRRAVLLRSSLERPLALAANAQRALLQPRARLPHQRSAAFTELLREGSSSSRPFDYERSCTRVSAVSRVAAFSQGVELDGRKPPAPLIGTTI